jgi:hypothetical protein
MGDLSKNFSSTETACKCGCGFKYPAPALIRTLQAIRDWLGKPVTIVSGCRCTEHNFKEKSTLLGKQGLHRGQVGDLTASAHTRGEAADIQAKGVSRAELYDEIVAMYKDGKLPDLEYVYGIGGSATNVHVGVDGKPRKSPYGGLK